VENLHIMAVKLGIAKDWFHPGTYPHYDIPKKRIKEITDKCKVISTRELFGIIKGMNLLEKQ
jgi:hypothetical protein